MKLKDFKGEMDAGKAAKGFLLENVEGLVNHDGGNTLAVIVDHLQKLGYNVNYKLIDSQYLVYRKLEKECILLAC